MTRHVPASTESSAARRRPNKKIVGAIFPDDPEAVPGIQRCDGIPSEVLQPRLHAIRVRGCQRGEQNPGSNSMRSMGPQDVELPKLQVGWLYVDGYGSDGNRLPSDYLPRFRDPALPMVFELKRFIPAPVRGDVRADGISLRLVRELEIVRLRWPEGNIRGPWVRPHCDPERFASPSDEQDRWERGIPAIRFQRRDRERYNLVRSLPPRRASEDMKCARLP